jgi:hypothetical protein
MVKLRQLLTKSILWTSLFAICAFAQSTLTQIQDTVYNPDGSPFNGTVVITWMSSSGQTGGTPYSTSVKIYNGALSVSLAPSVNAVPAASYQAIYNSKDGLVSWTETWQVPVSATAVTLSQVRQSGSIGTTGQGNIPISQVTGLASYLNAINGSLTSLSSTVAGLNSMVSGLGSSVANLTTLVNNLGSASTNAVFVDAESPAGTINGVNATFTLSQTPLSIGSLTVFRNGVMLTNGVDYTVSGSILAFARNAVPQTGDILQTYYRVSGTGQASSFADAELPVGTINGTNVTFTVAVAPNPALSLRLYKNGMLLQQNVDYSLSGSTISFVNAKSTPQPGDTLSAYYRH